MRSAFLALVVLAALPLTAQFRELDPHTGRGNPELRGLKMGQKLKSSLNWDRGSYQDLWASSSLRAEGVPPPVDPGPFEYPEDAMEANFPQVRWSEMYAPLKLLDGDPASAWVEGEPGPGVGAVVLIPIKEKDYVMVWNGFQASERLFTRNARAKAVRLILLQARRMAGQFGDAYAELKVIAETETVLRDARGGQQVFLPPYALPAGSDGPPWALLLAIEIRSVYPGTHYQDCCLSEVE